MTLLTSIDDLLAIEDRQYEYVTVPEWQSRMVRVRSLTGEERNKVGSLVRLDTKKLGEEAAAVKFQSRVIAASLVNDDGQLIAGQDFADKIAQKNGAALSRIYAACARLSGLGEDETEKATDELKAIPSASSGTD
jgi:hypothetical protein